MLSTFSRFIVTLIEETPTNCVPRLHNYSKCLKSEGKHLIVVINDGSLQ